jgi:hypothetical protein
VGGGGGGGGGWNLVIGGIEGTLKDEPRYTEKSEDII